MNLHENGGKRFRIEAYLI